MPPKTSKRSNEDSEAESEAKRATNEIVLQQQAVERAQEALDRMDYKTAEEICTQVSFESHLQKMEQI